MEEQVSVELDPNTEQGRALIDAHFKQQFNEADGPVKFVICKKLAFFITLGLVGTIVLILWLGWYLS